MNIRPKGKYEGTSSRTTHVALNEAFGKHVDHWLDMLKTSYDGRGWREDTPALYPLVMREESPRLRPLHKFSMSSAALSKAET